MAITESDYVEKAEHAVLEHKKEMVDNNQRSKKPIGMVTTSKIRNLLAMSADIYNEVINCRSEALSEEIRGRISYLKIRFIYEAGREPSVKSFIEKACILNYIKEINGSKKKYLLFHKYMEALVAYHRYHGGKDN